jgi:hypothetical protein
VADGTDMVSNLALTRELQRVRSAMRGDILAATVIFECMSPTCPVTIIRCAISEDRKGVTKPFHPPNLCIRCKQPLRYVGLAVGR